MVDRRGRARSFRRVASLGVEVRVRPRSGHLKFFLALVDECDADGKMGSGLFISQKGPA